MKTMLFIIVAFFALMILPAIAGYVMNTQWFNNMIIEDARNADTSL